VNVVSKCQFSPQGLIHLLSSLLIIMILQEELLLKWWSPLWNSSEQM